jgi:GTPase SAR1 family protein
VQLQFGRMRQTLTSMTENKCSVGDRAVPLIDVPGHPRLRESIRGKYAKQAKRVVFVIDSKEFKDTSRETAEYVAPPLWFSCIAQTRLLRMRQVCIERYAPNRCGCPCACE